MNQMTTADLVHSETTDGMTTLTLLNGKAHPLSLAMITALHEAVTTASQDDATRVLILHGPGHIFCAGHDLKEISRHRDDDDSGEAFLTRLFEACAAMMQAITNCPKPTIARVEGIATAAGLQIVAACDLAFATDAATFCLPGVRNGGFCTTPAVTVSRAVGRKHLMELLLTGAPKDAAWALRAGLINEVKPASEIAAHVNDLAHAMTAYNLGPIAAGKACTNAHLDMDIASAYDSATEVMVSHFMDPDRIAHEARSRWKAN
ncbi:enoyl-CoA hydratase-related protein [Rhodobacteraceae bacterium D3-12]|nr:enoyl-CoA hydratase-related protein [Rhodobacteraceae bacterium D3-12]